MCVFILTKHICHNIFLLLLHYYYYYKPKSSTADLVLHLLHASDCNPCQSYPHLSCHATGDTLTFTTKHIHCTAPAAAATTTATTTRSLMCHMSATSDVSHARTYSHVVRSRESSNRF